MKYICRGVSKRVFKKTLLNGWRKIMRIDLGMVLAIIFEYIIFIIMLTLYFTEKEISIFVMQ